jgi:hypothetical protein
MSAPSVAHVVQRALNNRWLEEQGVPDMRKLWIGIHYPDNAREV